jgi:hypothetical protein
MKAFLFFGGIFSSVVTLAFGFLAGLSIILKTVTPETKAAISADLKAKREAKQEAEKNSRGNHPAYGTSTFPYGVK